MYCCGLGKRLTAVWTTAVALEVLKRGCICNRCIIAPKQEMYWFVSSLPKACGFWSLWQLWISLNYSKGKKCSKGTWMILIYSTDFTPIRFCLIKSGVAVSFLFSLSVTFCFCRKCSHICPSNLKSCRKPTMKDYCIHLTIPYL